MTRILVLYRHSARKGEMRHAVERHLHALDGGDEEIVYVNASEPQPWWLRRERFDGVVLHTTFLGLRWNRTFERRRAAWAWIADLRVPKVALPQDEYRLAHVLDDWLMELGVDHVLSNFDEPARRLLYPSLHGQASFSTVLTGYVDEETAEYCRARWRPAAERPLDVAYRAGPARFWLGSAPLLKVRIGEAVAERAEARGLAVDISVRPEDTIPGRAWLDFLLSGRATLGAESGSSVLDPRGEIRERVSELLDADPSLTFAELNAAMPDGWDGYEFYAVGPRHLEAVVARTALVLVEGAYNGVLEAERHYIPVKRDLSDLDEALERLRDARYLDELTERAYEEVHRPGRWTLAELGRQIREALGVSGAQPAPRSVRAAALTALRRGESSPVWRRLRAWERANVEPSVRRGRKALERRGRDVRKSTKRILRRSRRALRLRAGRVRRRVRGRSRPDQVM